MVSWKCLQMCPSVSLHVGSKSDVCVSKKLMKEAIDSLDVGPVCYIDRKSVVRLEALVYKWFWFQRKKVVRPCLSLCPRSDKLKLSLCAKRKNFSH